jgi:Ca2+-binding EF-hand superfamily protein
VYFQEFECGVHFGGGENSKQEWSFTLYDFDGHGKITKEVIIVINLFNNKNYNKFFTVVADGGVT